MTAAKCLTCLSHNDHIRSADCNVDDLVVIIDGEDVRAIYELLCQFILFDLFVDVVA